MRYNIPKSNFKKSSIPFSKLLPNLVTLLSLIVGVSSIRFAIDNKWETAVYCIVVAAILDFLDGGLARLLKATSHFGAELDSLCDFVNFGLCPAITIYLWSFQQYEYKITSWSAIMMFISCMAVRLARFNTMLIDPIVSTSQSQNAKYFLGIPAPFGALLALMPIILDFELTVPIDGFYIRNYTTGINAYIVCISLSLVARFPTISLKSIRIKREFLSAAMVVFAALSIMLLIYPWYALPILAFGYIASIPLCVILFFRSKNIKPNV